MAVPSGGAPRGAGKPLIIPFRFLNAEWQEFILVL
jgi:hypothetical protein